MDLGNFELRWVAGIAGDLVVKDWIPELIFSDSGSLDVSLIPLLLEEVLKTSCLLFCFGKSFSSRFL